MTEPENPWLAVPKIIIGHDIEERLVWRHAVEELRRGLILRCSKPLYENRGALEGRMEQRAVGVEKLGAGCAFRYRRKDAGSARLRTRYPDYRLFSVTSEKIVHDASIDYEVVTVWRAVAASIIATAHLARLPPARITVLGAGRLAEKVIEGYCSYFTTLRDVTVWSRRPTQGEDLCARLRACGRCARANIRYEAAMATACRQAEVIVTTTSAEAPILAPTCVRPGAHVELIGASRPGVREADVRLFRRSALYVDDVESALNDSGELSYPKTIGVISDRDIVGTIKDIVAPGFRRPKGETNTLFKHGGAPHLDLIMARYIYARAVESEVFVSFQRYETSHEPFEPASEFPNPCGRVRAFVHDIRGTFEEVDREIAKLKASEALRAGNCRRR